MPRLVPHSKEEKAGKLADLVEVPPAPEGTDGPLWVRLERAIAGANRARAESRRSSSTAFTGLDAAFRPHGNDVVLKARSHVSSIARAAGRLQAAVEELETEATNAQAAHEADEANWRGDMKMLERKMESMRMAEVRTLKHELQRAELALQGQHEALTRQAQDELHAQEMAHGRHLRQLTLQFETDRQNMKNEGDMIRQRLERSHNDAIAQQQAAREAHDQLASEMMNKSLEASKLTNELEETRAMREAAEAAVATLTTANAKLRGELIEMGASYEATRADLMGQVERLTREKRNLVSELEAQGSHLQELREIEVSQLRGSLEEVKMRGTLDALHLQEQLAAANAERESDASSYEAKIARLRAIQRAALDAGSARGRQLLYAESLRNTDRIPSSMSWRGEDWESTGSYVQSGNTTPRRASSKSPKGIMERHTRSWSASVRSTPAPTPKTVKSRR